MKLRRIKAVQETSKKNNKRKKRLRRILLFIRNIFILALLVTTAVYAAQSPFFNIQAIEVKGAAHYDQQTLVDASGIIAGENGFRLLFEEPGRFYFLRVGLAEKAILESCPYIKTVKARFILPSRISIEVEERQAAAVLQLTGTSLLIDREGYLLEINPDLEKSDLPVIKGIKPATYKPGKKLDIPDDVLPAVFNLLAEIGELDSKNEDKLLPSVDYIEAGDMNNIGFSLQSRVLVNLGEPVDLNYKLNAVRTIFNKNIKNNERGKLDFSFDENPVFTPENGG